MKEEEVVALIDSLLQYLKNWEHYGDKYVESLRQLVKNGTRLSGLSPERDEIIRKLEELLLPEEWALLPGLVALRQADSRTELLSVETLERLRREEELRLESEETRRRELQLEQERIRRTKEELRRKRELEIRRKRAEAERKRHEEEEAQEREREREAAGKRRERERRIAEEERAREALRTTLRRRLEEQLGLNFLTADEYWRTNSDPQLVSLRDYEALKANFVRDWARRVMHDDSELDDRQAAAVTTYGGDIQVVARAGAGKTRTLVARAMFFQQHCGVEPHELLLLAFNNKAADEMRNRLEHVLGGRLPHVMTFHALAHALVHPDEELLYDDSSQLGLSRVIQEVIDDHLQSPEHAPLIKKVMRSHFEDDWERIEAGGFHLAIPELVKHREALPRETLRGEYVKSFGERLIANTLFRNGVDYKYERNYRWNNVNYRPDFTVLPEHGRGGVVIEYFGMKGDPDYDDMSEKKRAFWTQRENWTLIEFTPEDIASRGVDTFKELILASLKRAGVQTRALSDVEMWQLIERRAVDNFTQAVRSFVSRCRKRNLSLTELQDLVDAHSAIGTAEELFLEVAASVYSGYLDRLQHRGQEDFDGLMWRAIERIRSGNGRFVRDRGREIGDLSRLRFVLIDEFQDFSEMFYHLVDGIRNLSSGVQFFCVGDDWQAINAFAGSELRFFDRFDTFFRNSKRLLIDTNHRSPQQVVAVGNALMRGKGEPARAARSDCGFVHSAHLSDFTPTAPERARHDGDEITPAALRLTKRALDKGQDVVLLCRRNAIPGYVNYVNELHKRLDGLPRFEEHIRSYFTKEERKRVTVSTVHKYKGLEKAAVIVLDANEGSYPLIHPNWVFLRVFGDTIEAIESEERRLFYVALTRAQEDLVILSDDENRESRYVAGIRSGVKLDSIDWRRLIPVTSLDGARLEIRVSFPYHEARNEQLRKLGYHWDSSGKYWHRAVLREGFNFEALVEQPWIGVGVKVRVYTEAGKLLWKR